MKDNKDREEVLAAIKQNGWYFLEDVDKSLQKDKEIVLGAVKQNGCALEYADESLQKDKEIVLAAVKQDGWYLEYADESLKKDKEFVLEVLKDDGYALQFADKSLQKDKEIVMAAVKQDGRALEFADKSLQKDKEIVMAAVKQNEARDKDFVKKLEALKNKKVIHDNHIQYISLELENFFGSLIEDHKDFFAEENTFKVRPGVAYDKFYLDRIDGSYDMSLQGLIHHYMWEQELYHSILNEDEIKDCEAVVENSPEYIYGPEDEGKQTMLDEIQFDMIRFVGKKLIDLGFDVEETFKEYLDESL